MYGVSPKARSERGKMLAISASRYRPTRSEHRGADIAVVIVGITIAFRSPSPLNPRPFGRETWRDFGANSPPRAAGSPDAGYGGRKARDVAHSGPRSPTLAERGPKRDAQLTAGSDGSYRYTFSQALADGVRTFGVRTTDRFGQTRVHAGTRSVSPLG